MEQPNVDILTLKKTLLGTWQARRNGKVVANLTRIDDITLTLIGFGPLAAFTGSADEGFTRLQPRQ